MNPIPLLSCSRALLAVVLALVGLPAQAAPPTPLEVKGVPAEAFAKGVTSAVRASKRIPGFS